MSKLEVGQCVAVYEIHRHWGSDLGALRKVGAVKETRDDGTVLVQFPDHKNITVWFHSKQCRRLKRRKLREWEGDWMRVGLSEGGEAVVFVPDYIPESPDLLVGTSAVLREVRRPRKEGA